VIVARRPPQDKRGGRNEYHKAFQVMRAGRTMIFDKAGGDPPRRVTMDQALGIRVGRGQQSL
jgi:hypothetical protein